MAQLETTSSHENIELIVKLKKLILDQVVPIYGPLYPSTCTYAVTTTQLYGTYHACAIVYTKTEPRLEWRLLEKSTEQDSTVDAMKSLYANLQDSMDELMGDMLPGWICDGNRVRRPKARE